MGSISYSYPHLSFAAQRQPASHRVRSLDLQLLESRDVAPLPHSDFPPPPDFLQPAASPQATDRNRFFVRIVKHISNINPKTLFNSFFFASIEDSLEAVDAD
jgi:hypothetical protein